jgi:uncharacterized membrane protein
MLTVREGPMPRPRLILAAVMLLVGLVWIGQGIGLIPGSAMSGQSFWAIVGVVLCIAGAGLLWRSLGRPARRP